MEERLRIIQAKLKTAYPEVQRRAVLELVSLYESVRGGAGVASGLPVRCIDQLCGLLSHRDVAVSSAASHGP